MTGVSAEQVEEVLEVCGPCDCEACAGGRQQAALVRALEKVRLKGIALLKISDAHNKTALEVFTAWQEFREAVAEAKAIMEGRTDGR